MIRRIKYADREEWLKLRKCYIGGSDAASVVGLNPYKSAYSLWAEKTGKVEEFSGNLTTEVGAYLEEFVAKKFTEKTGKVVRRCNMMLVNSAYPFACADVDRILSKENAVLEIKTTTSSLVMRRVRGGEFPERYYAQCVHYMAVSGAKKVYLAILLNCRELQIFEIERDDDEIDALMDAEKAFWSLVANNTPPSADGTESTADALASVFPIEEGDRIDLTGYESTLSNLQSVCEKIKELEEQKKQIENEIKSVLGESPGGECGIYSVSWKSQTRSSFDKKRFSEDFPQIQIDKYYNKTSTRTFRMLISDPEK